MLAIERSSDKTHIQANLLPCKISHNGKVNASKRYWKPVASTDGSSTAYFRGRKLRGVSSRLPDGYEGAVLQKTDRIVLDIPPQNQQDAEEEDDLMDVEVPPPPREATILEEIGCFDSITVWHHENLPDSTEQAHLRGVDEWLKMAGAIHGKSASEADQK